MKAVFAAAVKWHGKSSDPWLEVNVPRSEAGIVASLAGKGWVTLTVEPVKRPRSTGPQSQNNRANGFLRQIANATGNDFGAVEAACKLKALDQGYPVVKVCGEWVAKSQADLTVEECARWIATIEQVAAEEGIELKED